jgi:competence ComEA-like helix-hairpin-helix protein
VKKNLLRYREHGGRFKKTSDFRKLYGMNDSIFALVEAYLLISPPSALISQTDLKAAAINPRTTIRSGMRVETPSAGRPVSINLNKSTAEELEKLKGIGPVLSKRIVKYRDLLGGYVSAMQLTEVYGLKPEVVEMNRSFVFADTLDIRKMDLNFLSVDELAAHPYINYKEARRIVDFRSKNGYISDKNILLSDSVIGEEHFRKLSSYLK